MDVLGAMTRLILTPPSKRGSRSENQELIALPESLWCHDRAESVTADMENSEKGSTRYFAFPSSPRFTCEVAGLIASVDSSDMSAQTLSASTGTMAA